MCILKIHANSHTANGIQSVVHNLDTNLGDIALMSRVLDARGHSLEAERLRLAHWHVEKAQLLAIKCWEGFIADSPIVDSPPIGAESVEHSEHGSYFKYNPTIREVQDADLLTVKGVVSRPHTSLMDGLYCPWFAGR